MNPFFSTPQFASASDACFDNKSSTADNASEIALINILVQEKLCLERVIQLLKTENAAIKIRDTAAMGSLLDKKLPLFSKLEQLDKQRQQSFEQHTGIPYNTLKFSDFVQHHPSDTLQTLWQTIKQQLPECRKQNELNGRIINIRQKNTEQILQILLGHPTNNNQTYSHLGQTSQQKKSALYTAV